MSQHFDVSRVIETAKRNIRAGVIREPRIYASDIFVAFTSDGPSQIGYPAPDIFRNGEEYPVRIHTLTASVVDILGGTDERWLQRVGLRMIFHDQYYMRRDFVALPIWHNVPVAAAPAIARGQSAWKLHAPFVLSSRDSMDVQFALQDQAPEGARICSFGMTGVGMDSRRPYFKSASTEITAAFESSALALRPLNPEFLRNDGDEPIVITDVNFFCSAPEDSSNPQGDIRQLRAMIRQMGNGTQAQWVNGAVQQTTGGFVPGAVYAPNLGVTSGRCLVHHFPGEGLLWEPGEGIRIEAARLRDFEDPVGTLINVALIGTIEVV
jgi:hypothetical protein